MTGGGEEIKGGAIFSPTIVFVESQYNLSDVDINPPRDTSLNVVVPSIVIATSQVIVPVESSIDFLVNDNANVTPSFVSVF